MVLFSDDATTFVGASKELKEACQEWIVDETHKILNLFGAVWKFMPPLAPHQGGIHEAAVNSAKYHPRGANGNNSCMYEQYMTLLNEIEAILNSRPSRTLSDEPSETQALTPGHFLVGVPLRVPIAINPSMTTKASVVKLWSEFQEMKKHLWRKWSSGCLPRLQKRGVW